jgi:hypothetical protein
MMRLVMATIGFARWGARHGTRRSGRRGKEGIEQGIEQGGFGCYLPPRRPPEHPG